MSLKDVGKDSKQIVERSTRQQSSILEALYGIDEFKSAQEIHALLAKKKLKVGLATVYRTLQKMAEKEDIDAIKSTEGETLYRHCGQNDGHHHHLICNKCGLTITVEGPAIENWTEKVAKENGFSEVSHKVDIFGVCKGCRRK
ncbi:MAG: transcriptional repressor [Actinomycetota bacterium]|nr:transcriptional repressor [Actinomycetota bacterium]